MEKFEGSVSCTAYFADTMFLSLSGAARLGKEGIIGLHVTDLFYSSIPETLEDGSGAIYETGERAEAGDFVLTGTYCGSPIAEKLHVGASVKYITLKLDDSQCSRIGADIGRIYRDPAGLWGVGIAVNNLGSRFRFVQRDYSLPISVRAGGNYRCRIHPYHVITGAMDLEVGGITLRADAEYSYKGFIFIRSDYQTGTDPGGFNLGCGLKYKVMRFDYGLGFYGELGLLHRLQASVILLSGRSVQEGRTESRKGSKKGDPDVSGVIDDLIKENGDDSSLQKKADEKDDAPDKDKDLDSLVK